MCARRRKGGTANTAGLGDRSEREVFFPTAGPCRRMCFLSGRGQTSEEKTLCPLGGVADSRKSLRHTGKMPQGSCCQKGRLSLEGGSSVVFATRLVLAAIRCSFLLLLLRKIHSITIHGLPAFVAAFPSY